MERSTGNNMQVATAMAMAGRSARPCDVCGRDRARWYCAADEAYLCHRCDGSVHSANAVALRHERVRVNPSGLPSSKPTRRSSPSSATQISKEIYTTKDFSQGSILPSYGWQHRSHKKPRSSRPHPNSSALSAISHSNNGGERDQETSMVKAEPSSPALLEIQRSPPSLYMQHNRSKQELDEAAHEVPVLLPMKQEFSPRSFAECTLLVSSLSEDAIANEDALEFLVPDDYAMDRFIDSGADLGEMEVKMEGSVGEEASITMELPLMDDMEVLGLCGGHDLCGEDFPIDFSSMEAFRVVDAASDGDCVEDAVEGSGDEVSVDKVKMEEESWEDGEGLKIEVDEMLACEWNGWQEEEVKQKISLRLNYEDVLSAWSDRGPLWADGRSSQMVPDDNSTYETSVAATNALDYGCLDIGLVPDISLCSGTSTTGEQLGQVPVVNVGEESMSVGAREARVMRYREKRRTRLFSKKIRYEGRFVKKTTSL
ncbi:hypothetical protein O6H91_12G069900 [Diphasiastrum complanatum]|uniref:Uncharacterized protein n=2 Tax=Diphasiastrum complanatum TaxID=34168 RepID=A0ACC2C352_DIPCM|nr:hypothetical protein O6H91_12G060300 [Diphasiastrum complanatum]KAJ7536451.1 hypothetical protein O6H91_12G069900 [Diphasiastrum complanatum]